MNLDRKHMTAAEAEAAHIDVGLRNYMLGVYNHMTIGLALTGFIALGTNILAMSSPAFLLTWVVALVNVPDLAKAKEEAKKKANGTVKMEAQEIAAKMPGQVE